MIDGTVIIGHGPSLQGRCLGKYIDSFRYVLRFPYRGKWQIPEDYGTRTSYWCATTLRAKLIREYRMARSDLGYFIWDKHGNHLTPNWVELIKTHGGVNVTYLLVTIQDKVPLSSRYVSHGTAAILIALDLLEKPITVLGCDNLSRGADNGYRGSADWEPNRYRASRCQNHHYSEELKLVEYLADHYNTKVSFLK